VNRKKNFQRFKGSFSCKVRYIELGKQYHPNTTTYKDYLKLKNLLEDTVNKIAKSERPEEMADGEPYEIKAGQASGLDVYRLFAYMDMGERNGLPMKRGYLVAPSFTTGASQAASFIKKKHGKGVVLAPLEDFPINQPMSTEEIEKYL